MTFFDLLDFRIRQDQVERVQIFSLILTATMDGHVRKLYYEFC